MPNENDALNSENHAIELAEGSNEDVASVREKAAKDTKARSQGRNLRILAVLAVLAISGSLFAFRHQVGDLGGYGYLGAFLISLISSATVILPVPGMALIFIMGMDYNPWLIGLAAGAGSTLGEITGYVLGYSGQKIFRDNKTYLRLERWMKKRGTLIIFVLAL